MNEFPFPSPHLPPPAAPPSFKQRMARVQDKLMHAMDQIADRYVAQYGAAPEQGPPDTPEVRRRTAANALKIWRACPRHTCRRTHACRGEPAHCLQACLPALPEGTFEAYVAESRKRRKRT